MLFLSVLLQNNVLVCFDSETVTLATWCSPFLALGGPSCPSRCTQCGPDAASSPEGAERDGGRLSSDGRKRRQMKLSLFVSE